MGDNNRQNNRKRKKNKSVPVTGILAGAVVILAIAAVLLGRVVLRDGTDAGQQDSPKQQSLQTGKMTDTEEVMTEQSEEDQAGESEEQETQTESEKTTEKFSETEPEDQTEEESQEEAESEPEEKLVVAIDPGHQGNWIDMSDTEPLGPGSAEMKAKATTGTQGSFSGLAEFELNLEVSLLLRSELEGRGYQVVMTREDNDAAISNAERAQLAYEQGGDIYVRIHANGSEDSSVNGALAMVPSPQNPYVSELADDSYFLAQCILDQYCSRARFASQGIQYYDNMSGINWSKIPVMILEMGYMTNQSDDTRMADSQVQQQMAAGIADGIDLYFEQMGMKRQEITPEDQGKITALLERIGEEYVYQAEAQGEKWAVAFRNLSTKAEGNIHGGQQMKSASIIKVFIMAAIYDRVCYPSSEDRRIFIEETYDGELKQLITDMITVSDNNAANTLIERLGGGNAQEGMNVVNQFCQENGYTSTFLGREFLVENPGGDNFTSANDCCSLLADIYEGKCVNAEASAKMYEYLKQQTRTGKIPAGISDTGARTANKTGELAGEYGDYVENDIAVIEAGDCSYVLCVMSSDLQDNGAGASRIANISRLAYELR